MKVDAALPVAVCAFLAATPALASPQIWVAVRSEVVFDREARIVALRHAWEFDEFYSSTITGEVDGAKPTPGRKERGSISERAMEAFAQQNFFTFAKHGETKLSFKLPEDMSVETNEKNIVTLRFTVPISSPLVPREPFLFQVRDPSYVVSFGFEKSNPVAMVGASAGCALKVVEPESLVAAYGQEPPTSATIICR